MPILQQILFLLLLVAATWIFTRKVKQIRRNILLGVDEDLSGKNSKRWQNVLLLALGQKKMFRYPLVAMLHFVIYAGFIIINVEVLEIVIDGIAGSHRIFANSLGVMYPFIINLFEILALGVLGVCIVFLVRRNIMKLTRFMKHELDGWPRTDANLILIIEIVLMSLFIMMNSADRALQIQGYGHYQDHGAFLFSGIIGSGLSHLQPASLVAIERTCWWLHIIGIFAFLNYLPYSKHLHILLAFPNTYYARLEAKGQMDNMENVQKEVTYMFKPELAAEGSDTAVHKFGAKDIFDLSWKSLLDAYSCTECGRCTAACPANQTGKLLNPRKIMMDTRDRLEEVGNNLNTNKEFKNDGKTLLHDYITSEELRACTTCNACVEECPVSIDPLSIILELRRSLVMEESNAPAEWNGMFSNIENNFAPWKFSPEERDAWTR